MCRFQKCLYLILRMLPRRVTGFAEKFSSPLADLLNFDGMPKRVSVGSASALSCGCDVLNLQNESSHFIDWHISIQTEFRSGHLLLDSIKKSLDKILNNPTKDSFYECIVSINQWTIKICVNGPIRGIPLTSAFNFISYPESSISVKISILIFISFRWKAQNDASAFVLSPLWRTEKLIIQQGCWKWRFIGPWLGSFYQSATFIGWYENI